MNQIVARGLLVFSASVWTANAVADLGIIPAPMAAFVAVVCGLLAVMPWDD